jgi:hypothetical protein
MHCRWVPKVARHLIKDPDDLAFYDIVEYDPEKLEAPPYRLHVTSYLPMLGDKVPRAILCSPAHRTIIFIMSGP